MWGGAGLGLCACWSRGTVAGLSFVFRWGHLVTAVPCCKDRAQSPAWQKASEAVLAVDSAPHASPPHPSEDVPRAARADPALIQCCVGQGKGPPSRVQRKLWAPFGAQGCTQCQGMSWRQVLCKITPNMSGCDVRKWD